MIQQLGRFPVQAEIGRGAMGVVYRGWHPGLDVPVAIKVLADQYSRDQAFRERFQREAATIASLNHPGIVRVYDFDSVEGALFIVMEWVEGRSLRAWLTEYHRFTVEVSLDLIQQVLSAVGAAHDRGIVHRDLKPDNVLISNRGKTKILDFGISKLVDDKAHLTATGSMVGTPAYMAPEQVKGMANIDKRADVYSLGMMLYEMLHGEPPFVGPLPAILHSQVFDQPRPSTAIPQPIMEIFYRATAKDPAQRFTTCEEFAGALLYTPKAAEAVRPATPPQPLGIRIGLPRIGLPKLGGDHEKQGGCSFTGCGGKEGWACTYRDLSGRPCGTWWCDRHIQFVENTAFCPRHASVIKALAITAGTIREIKNLPAVDDRALPLAALVGEDVDKDITELLRRRYQSKTDVQIVADRTVRQTYVGRQDVAWERSWAALHGNNYIARVGVRVTYAEPDKVQVLIGNTMVFAEVPDWISHRREGEPPAHGDRARFRKKIVEVVMKQVDQPTPVTSGPPPSTSQQAAVSNVRISQTLAEGLILRLLQTATRLTGYEIGERLALPFSAAEPVLKSLTSGNFLEALGISSDPGPWKARPLPEQMSYSITNQGRTRSEEIASASTRYLGPAPVSPDEYKASLAAAARPGSLTPGQVQLALEGIEVPPGVVEAIVAAVNSRSSVFIYGAPGNGKTSLARRIVRLLGGAIVVPIALDLDGEVLTVFTPSVHKPVEPQPADRRWRRVERPLVQVGGEFEPGLLDPTWEAGSRTYGAPLQVQANGGVLLIDDLGRQRVTPKQIMDRLLVPLEQEVDYMNLTSSGRKAEVPFKTQLALSTNLKPGDLLDEAYLRRLSYKVFMPDPTWEAWCRIFEREREKMGIPPNPQVLEVVHGFYGERPLRGNHPRDLLERLTDVAAARGIPPQLTTDLVQAAWQTLFVAS
ncbi:MAG TPA: protein kinase [Candidatus Acidoferrales bacterium]|nr:protein kinase [Candidatus Acidoferrales bacterium]